MLKLIFRRRNFRLTVDGRIIGFYRTDAEANAAVPDDFKRNFYVHEMCGRHWFSRGFGYTATTTSTLDLAQAGVPIHPDAISDKEL